MNFALTRCIDSIHHCPRGSTADEERGEVNGGQNLEVDVCNFKV